MSDDRQGGAPGHHAAPQPAPDLDAILDSVRRLLEVSNHRPLVLTPEYRVANAPLVLAPERRVQPPRRDMLLAAIESLEGAVRDAAGFEPDGSEVAPTAAIDWVDEPERPGASAPASAPAEDDVVVSFRRARGVEEASQPPPAPAPAPEPDLTLDMAELEATITRVVREELRGTLGDRITANVRKLVRREIARMIASGDLR
ncbi:MAG: hypothetical protein ACU0BF_13400 [Paracoccaceae bacterium]